MSEIINKSSDDSEVLNQRDQLSLAEKYPHEPFDVMLHAWLERFTHSLFSISHNLALLDWILHLSMSPAKQFDLYKQALFNIQKLCENLCEENTQSTVATISQSNKTESRFHTTAWNQYPFKFYKQAFLLGEQWLEEATTGIRGISAPHLRLVNFFMRQWFNIYSPANFPWSNPEVIKAATETKGNNFLLGLSNFLEDTYRNVSQLPPAGTESFQPGINIAVTPGKVIYRNNLIELIQYLPTTKNVYAEPILIVPACIMKYYILDLSPQNSLVKYLVDSGHTVFMISWKNPVNEDKDLGFDDYINLGIMDSLAAISAIVPKQKIHGVGYCIGGTMLAIATAALAKKSNNRLKTISMFTAQIDFENAGDLKLFIDQNQVDQLEDMMWDCGYLDGNQMAGAFNLLKSNELVWSRIIHNYLLGERRKISDLMAWNADTTRLPCRMHSEYLRYLFLQNDLSQGRFKFKNKNIALIDIRTPIFSISTLQDYVSPWESVYKIHLFTDTDITFVLATGMHNAGIVSRPGPAGGRSYQMNTRKRGEKYVDPVSWSKTAPKFSGSWWPAWQLWLVNHSSKQIVPPTIGNTKEGYEILADAPGTYVLQR